MDTELLPEDVLANILDCLRPCDLAQSRCVCRPWQALIDERRLLLRHTLPHSVHGFFLKYTAHDHQHFLERPSSAGPQIDGRLRFVPDAHRSVRGYVRDHHNGLILYAPYYSSWKLVVVNPATRQWTALPPLVEARTWAGYIVFEPAVSPHYEVFLVPPLSEGDEETDGYEETDGLYRLMEWPPSPCVLQVFSSKTGRWEKRSFAREGEAAGFVSELRLESSPFRHLWRHAVHLEGTLYVQCRGAYVMRLSLHEDKYQVIKTPIGITKCAEAQTYLGGSQNQVCFAAIEEPCKLSVWILNESSGCRDWMLKHQGDVALSYHYNQVTKKWILDDDEYANIDLLGDDMSEEEGGFSGSLFYNSGDEKDTTDKEIAEENIEWDSDEDNVVRIKTEGLGYVRNISILGFHPYKEVIFLTNSSLAFAYQLKTSIYQHLGVLGPTRYNYYSEFGDVELSFLYTPCMIGELENNCEE